LPREGGEATREEGERKVKGRREPGEQKAKKYQQSTIRHNYHKKKNGPG
jgi:hypothetical protein